MKSRWWSGAALLVAFGLLSLPGCGGPAELPMEETNLEEDLAEDADAVLETEDPEASGP